MTEKKTFYKKKYTEKEIVSELEQYLAEQKLPPNTMIAPASRLSLRYNVSPATVNRAIDRLVERRVLYRVQGSGTFTARAVEAERRLRIGLFMRNTGMDRSDLYGQVAFGNQNTMFQQYFQRAGHDCSFYFHQLPFPPEQLAGIRLYDFDAVIILKGHASRENSELLKKFNIPVVMIMDDKVSRSDFHQVIFNFEPGFRKLLAHLREMGHRSFLIAGNEPGRTDAILEAADNLGIPRRNFEHQFCKGYRTEYWHTVESAYTIAEYYLTNRPRFSAIMSTSDYISRGIIDYLSGKGLEPGRDYAISSYDNFEKQGMLIHGARPILTSITHPLERLTLETVKLTISEAVAPSGVKHIVEVLADELDIRASTRLKIKTNRGETCIEKK